MNADNGAQPQKLRPRAPAPPGFAAFFRQTYIELLRYLRYLGANEQEAKDAVAAAMAAVLAGWNEIEDPAPYAVRVASNAFYKERQRGLERTRRRLVERGAVPAESNGEPGLNSWEDREWVMQMIKSLPPAQRDVMALAFDNYTPKEMADLLGKTPAAIRQSLRAARQRLQRRYRAEQEGMDPAKPPKGSPGRKER